MKKLLVKIQNIKTQVVGTARSAYAMGLASMLAASQAQATGSDPFGATAVQGEAKNIAEFIVGLLNGWVGYVLALIAFFAGIFFYFKNRDLWGTMGAFGLAIMIMIVPPVLKGFFSGAT